MIITKLRIQEEHVMSGPSGSWPLPLFDFNLDSSAGENGYILKTAQGLDPPDLISIVIGFDSVGTPIMDSVAEKREIVLRLGLVPVMSQTYSSLRDNLYRFINRTVMISLMDDSIVIAQARGFISKVEAVHFSNTPDIQMTIECVEGEFTAPFAINIPWVDLDTLEPVISYEEGTAPTGLELQFYCSAVIGRAGFTIFNHSRVWFVGATQVYNEFTLTFPLITDDVITISTQPKNKRITLLRAAVTYDLAGYVNAGAVWPKLYPGVNAFEWDLSTEWMEMVSASYTPKYWGV